MRSYNTYCLAVCFSLTTFWTSSHTYTYKSTGRHTRFFYTVQLYHCPFNHSFIDSLSFFQFSPLETMLPWKLPIHKSSAQSKSICGRIPGSGTDGLKEVHVFNFKTALPICPIYTPTYHLWSVHLEPLSRLNIILSYCPSDGWGNGTSMLW